ncbi:uncharacterized protein LOC113508246 [Trichoplusia ni]|uniref:Uncharacterized protein LOC113508246 n=1 Tax=Trichoplusia ni TaxID=7111 RepID=A0A7E5X1F5_TRINI|nr:uncharacterized protein LOC113508246 [Trichoplusia ni]XP_026747003.1 uncharacterized protein LOC113508246 [Trichoplusia ni]
MKPQNLTCCILMLDILLKQMELIQRPINTQNVSSEATKLLRLMLNSNQTNTRCCCGAGSARVTWPARTRWPRSSHTAGDTGSWRYWSCCKSITTVAAAYARWCCPSSAWSSTLWRCSTTSTKEPLP